MNESRILTRDMCETVAQRIAKFVRGPGETKVFILSWWNGETRWARNQVSLGSDRRDIGVSVSRIVGGRGGSAETNQLDDVSLEATVRMAERLASLTSPQPDDLNVPPPPFDVRPTAIWSDATYDVTAEGRGRIARTLIAPTESAGLLSAGYLETRAQGGALITFRDGRAHTLYASATQAQCTVSVRDATGTGSGWAGLSSYDWSTIDAPALATRALEKCKASRQPVKIEPGRYTVILEPQAVHDLVSIIVAELSRILPEAYGVGTFVAGRDDALNLWRTKLGLQIVDERVTISHDPADPALGVVPITRLGEPYQPVKWIDRGVLTALEDGRDYALRSRNENLGRPNSGSFRMSGGTASMEEMIQGTQRGLLVTRFSNLAVLDSRSLLATGLTRDGLWLIENGKIITAVRNLRLTESPLFVLNQIEQLGVPVPVFRPVTNPYIPGVTPAIVPPLKARDFSFTSLSDAV